MLSSNTVLKNKESGDIYSFVGVIARINYTFWWTFKSGSHEISFSIPALCHNEYEERLAKMGYEIID